jgi:hypothetical protein
MSGLMSRIAGAEARLRLLRPGLRVISIRGGLQNGVADLATVDGVELEPAPGESSDAFRARARESAIAAGAKVLVFGGLPMARGRADA